MTNTEKSPRRGFGTLLRVVVGLLLWLGLILLWIYFRLEHTVPLATVRLLSDGLSLSQLPPAPLLTAAILIAAAVWLLLRIDRFYARECRVSVMLRLGKRTLRLPLRALALPLALLCLLGVGALTARTVRMNLRTERRVEAVRHFVTEERDIVHAGGNIELDGVVHSCTNSREALKNAWAHGNRLIEVDFLRTKDGDYVCAHNGESGVWARGFVGTSSLTRSEFLAQKFDGCLTTMDLNALIAFMRQHEGLYVVTDCKNDNVQFCAALYARAPDLVDRFIIQAYHAAECIEIRALGLPLVIYTLYLTTPQERSTEALQQLTGEIDLVGITFWGTAAVKNKALMADLRSTGLPLMVHTVNSREEMETVYAPLGISGFYTDLLKGE